MIGYLKLARTLTTGAKKLCEYAEVLITAQNGGSSHILYCSDQDAAERIASLYREEGFTATVETDYDSFRGAEHTVRISW